MNFRRHTVWRAAVLGCAVCVCSQAQASPLTLNVVEPDKRGPAGATYLFEGTITNNTSATLTESDLFLDFNGYDFSVVSLSQLLGDTGFVLNDGATSAVLNLFDFTVDPGAIGGTTYVADVGISDALGNASDAVVPVSVTIPEPASAPLVALSLLCIGVAMRRKHSSTGDCGAVSMPCPPAAGALLPTLEEVVA